MDISRHFLILALVSSTLFNFSNTYARIAAIISMLAVPLVAALATQIKAKNEILSLIVLWCVSVTWMCICYIYNIDSFDLKLDGPAVEKLTPALLISGILLFHYYKQTELKYNSKTILIFYIIIVLITALDAAYRYYIGPEYFLNYNTRYAAKTIGFFSTTNVTGQTLAFLLSITWLISFKYKRAIQILLATILITTMARAAIVACIIGYAFHFFINKKGWLNNVGKAIALTVVISLLIIDPMNFRNDGSFQSKIDFFITTLKILENSSIDRILLGYGASFEAIITTLNVNNWSPHLPFLKAYLYYGIPGLVFYILLFYIIYRKNKKILVPIFTFFVLSLAGAPIYWPTIFVGLIILEISKNQNFLNNR